MIYIYTLSHPITKEIRYVGQTTNIRRRFNAHLSSSNRRKSDSYYTHKSKWIRKILNEGLMPIIEIIDTCYSLTESNSKERYYIEKLTNEGSILTNSYSSDVTTVSDETRVKISKGLSLFWVPNNQRCVELKKIYSDRMKENNINKNYDPEVRKKISETLVDYFSDKNNHWAYGKNLTEEHKEKSRLSHLNNVKNVGNKKPRTEEQKRATSEKITGTKVKRSKILQINLDGLIIKEWNSLREISRVDQTLSRKQISECCKELRQTYAGFIWKYSVQV